MWAKAVQRNSAIPNLLLYAKRARIGLWVEDTCTPFEILVRKVSRLEWSDIDRQDALQLWAGSLAEAGINLQKSGEKEVCKKLPPHRSRRMSNGFIPLTYGSAPENWHVWWEHTGDVYAGMFWELIEHGHRQIPGAWVEEEYIPWNDRWRQGQLRGRPIGIKRRVLRRLRAKAKRPGTMNANERRMIGQLQDCVTANAEARKMFSWLRRGSRDVLDLATSLGITTSDFRDWW